MVKLFTRIHKHMKMMIYLEMVIRLLSMIKLLTNQFMIINKNKDFYMKTKMKSKRQIARAFQSSANRSKIEKIKDMDKSK